MHIVGLTGGIASGKSTVSGMLRARGCPVVDADGLARQVVEPGTPALDDIKTRWGDAIVGSDGALDRRALGRIVFADPEARRQLEAITHPRIAQAAREAFDALAGQGHRVAFYDHPLLVEMGQWQDFDAVVVVSAPAEIQRARLLERDPDLSPHDADARIASQFPAHRKESVATHVIVNDATLDELEERVDAMLIALEEKLNG